MSNPAVTVQVLKRLGFNVFTLANNHLRDYGNQGLINTIEECKKQGILYVGAGHNTEEAKQPLILEKDGQKVGVINVCENESSIATSERPGAAPLDVIEVCERIKTLKQKVDKVLLIVHGGCEHFNLPTPRMKRLYRFFADNGADAIVNHHQHCYNGYEEYNGVPIFYGLGNFYFDNHKKRNCAWNYGLMVQLTFGEKVSFKIIPIEQCNENPDLIVKEEGAYDEKINVLNGIIADDKKLEKEFDRFIENHRKPLSAFLPYGNHYLKALYHRGLLPSFLSKKRIVTIENNIRCESHREVLLKFLQNNE